MSSPTSPRLRSCRSGRPARRPVRSVAPGGWFCHTCLRALVERSLCSLQGPSTGARTFDRPTTHPTSEKVRHLVMPAEASGAVPSQEAGATRLRRGPHLDRAQGGCPPVALIAAQGRSSAGRHCCRWASERSRAAVPGNRRAHPPPLRGQTFSVGTIGTPRVVGDPLVIPPRRRGYDIARAACL